MELLAGVVVVAAGLGLLGLAVMIVVRRRLAVRFVGLLLVPWQWHHRFGQWAIPLVIRHLRWYGLAAAALGAFILVGAFRPLLS